MSIRFGVLTVSDRCSTGETEDKSGPALEAAIKSYNSFTGVITKRGCVPDNVLNICETLIEWSDSSSCDVLLTTGGTGFALRDVTPEATHKVVTKRCDGLALMGAVRSASLFAFLSRAAAGIREKTLIINLPGSARGAIECFETIAPLLNHAVHLIIGDIEAVSKVHTVAHSCDTPPSAHILHGLTNLSQKQLMSLAKDPSTCQSSSLVKIVKSGLRDRVSQWPMVKLTEAQRIVLGLAELVSPSLASVPLMESLGRIGAECLSSVNLPPFRASVKDGYAVRVADGVSPRLVVSSSSAGDQVNVMIKEGECVRINTGAPLPQGADAVVQVEDTNVLNVNEEFEETRIEILKLPTLGQDIREIGSDMWAGSVIMESGNKITSSSLGVLASSGITQVPCWSVRVCVFSTGDELSNLGQPLDSGKIYDSNRHTLISLLREHSFPATDGGIIRDQPDDICRRLKEELITHDVLITTGSVSMGDKDYLKQVIETDLKAKIHFGRIDLKPGKPTTFADVKGVDGKQKLIFCLPGNPVSAAVTCHLLVLPSLRKITNHSTLFSPTIDVQVSEDVIFDYIRKEFKRAVVTYNSSSLPTATVTEGQASSRLGSMLEANALITTEKPTSLVQKGWVVTALMIGNFRFEN